jgi:hypothetical protein
MRPKMADVDDPIMQALHGLRPTLFDAVEPAGPFKIRVSDSLPADTIMMIADGAVQPVARVCPVCAGRRRIAVPVDPDVALFAIMHGLPWPTETKTCDRCKGAGVVGFDVPVLNPRGVGIIRGLSRL